MSERAIPKRPGPAVLPLGGGAEAPVEEISKPRGKSRLRLIVIALGVLLITASVAGGGWYFFLAGATPEAAETTDPPIPSFVEVKPFVVSMKADDGSMHYVQLAFSMKVPGAPAVEAVTLVMPEIQDLIRQTVLGFKIDQLAASDGVDKLRQALIGGVNGLMVRSLGANKVKKLAGDGTGAKVVENIFFSNLVIE